MTKIEIFYQKGTFALLVDGANVPIQNEGDLLDKFIALGITKERSVDYVGELKQTQQPIQVQ